MSKEEKRNTPTIVRIAAAASLVDALEAMKPDLLRLYGVEEIDIYQGSSGYLAARIIAGTINADIFFPAASFPMQDLIDEELVLASAVRNVLGNKLVLIKNKVADWSNRPAITGFGNVQCANTVAVGTKIFVAIPYNYPIGDPNGLAYNVPAGRYAKATFQHFHNWDFVEAHATFTDMWNVRQVLNAVADCPTPAVGVVYETDALYSPRSSCVSIIDTAPSAINNSIIYPIAPIVDNVGAGIVESVINFIRCDGLHHFTDRGFIDRTQQV